MQVNACVPIPSKLEVNPMSVTAAQFLPFHRALIEEEEINAVLGVLQTGWLTTGPRAREFEEKFRSYVGAAHAIAVNSCTAGLHLSLAVIGIADYADDDLCGVG
jgi:dTDP-4-amino-4,6-dideoxygalactose transaminase